MLDDDYFNRAGQYLGSDNANTDYIRVVNGNKLLDFVNATLDLKTNFEQIAKISTQLQSGSLDHSVGATISDLITETGIGKEANVNIVKHYSSELGNVEGKHSGVEIRGKGLGESIVMRAEYKGNTGVLGIKVSGESEKISINVNSDGKMSKYLNTASNVMNTLVHEYKHLPDSRRSFSERQMELRAIDAQKTHPTYINTTSKYKRMIDNYERKFTK